MSADQELPPVPSIFVDDSMTAEEVAAKQAEVVRQYQQTHGMTAIHLAAVQNTSPEQPDMGDRPAHWGPVRPAPDPTVPPIDYSLAARRMKVQAEPTPEDEQEILSSMVTRSTISTRGLNPVISGYIYENSLFRIIGKPGSMKSFVMLDMAAAVAEGKPWYGNPVKQGNVIIIAAEGSEGIGKRMAAWEHINQRPFPENVYIVDMPLQVMSVKWKALQNICSREPKPALVIGDTQARLTLGVNENGANEMGEVVQRLDDLRKASGAAVGLVHHSTKTGEGGGRGSSAVEGATQTEISVTKSEWSAHEPWVATVRSTRQKDEGQKEELELTSRLVGERGELGHDIHGKPITSLGFEPMEQFGAPKAPPRSLDALIVDYVSSIQHLGATSADIRSALKSSRLLKGKSPDAARKAIDRDLDRLVSGGQLVKLLGSTARWTVPSNVDESGQPLPAFLIPEV